MDARVKAINTIFIKAAVVECYSTGRPVGDLIETAAISRVFGDFRAHITSVKPNLDHSQGASGIIPLIQSVLALKQQTIPSDIKFSKPFNERNLTVPFKPTPWPQSTHECIRINSFGMGGTNGHASVDSATSFFAIAPTSNGAQSEETPELRLL
ncbi:hypothetical protein M431DRAFT_488820 [Trichoderma harzianum CBS 226.95]|uniref:Ketosynthase family 3 (KS3) domain-containing protein n=1 Tax=Trichoderma harzianum CBS 226.95 TaxID=983964 RepID=A0A2T4ASL5_TRIHA|nr:hypothetical protein M431DRAFT_488820 [Trichoderma harzianum CBS 226.95]PTB60050.1 hypothetical protein M431DRAFT_488820 [Trichoderma harzianum CBS 226.95]